MHANAVSILSIFQGKIRLEVPLFQRQYVWNQEHQWQPLWEDLARKFTDYLEGRRDAPLHFLGAMVLDQKQVPTTHVEKRQVIDGQQRLTTFQIFIAALRDFCREHGCDAVAGECEPFLLNQGLLSDPEVEKFKVWPTQLDRPQFIDVITAGSKKELETRHPLIRRKFMRSPDPRPRMVEAYLFFYRQFADFFIGTTNDPAIGPEFPLSHRLEECWSAIRNAFRVVAIDLDRDDDAQVIFETLNARGEPLLPADLLRNYIFLRAGRAGENQEQLYEKYWRRFDDQNWRDEVRQGRLSRPRSDLFLQHFLSSRQALEIPIKHLFVEYRFWIERSTPFNTVRDELATIAARSEDFRRLLEPKDGDALFDLATFLNRFDVSTAYPLLLHLFEVGLTDQQWQDVSAAVESYLLRRAVCGLTTKNYNRVFLTLTRNLQRDGATPENIRAYLSELKGDSTEWPDDKTFEAAWHSVAAYRTFQNMRLVYMLRRLSDTYLSNLQERVVVNGPLTVEHIMPQRWTAHWLLPDGSQGIEVDDLVSSEADPRAIVSHHRHSLVQTLGNLTLVTQELNSSISNGPWPQKKPAILSSSLLPINQQLYPVDVWNEEAIRARAGDLFRRACRLWPGPERAIKQVSAAAD